MTFQIEQAQKEKVKLKLGLFGPSGSGKTYSALRLAYGMTGDRKKICVIDTENRSASLYADQGEYQVINFGPPFSPDRYIEAIKAAASSGAEVVIIDSITHERNGRGGVLDMKETMTGNDFAKRGKLTPLHNSFLDAILQTPAHIIVTGRTKEEYSILTGSDGRIKVEKAGTNIIQRDGVEYELTLSFTIDIKHNATSSKDRTGLFMDKTTGPINEETGKTLLARCNKWVEAAPTMAQAAADPTGDFFRNLITLNGLGSYEDVCHKAFDAIVADPTQSQPLLEKLRSGGKFDAETEWKLVSFIMSVAEYVATR